MICLRIVLVGMVCSLAGCYATTTPEPEIIVPHLITLLQDPHPALRQTAALSLGKIASPEAVPDLILALRDTDPLVRQYSAWARGNLGEHAKSEATSALLPLLEDPVRAVAEAAAQAIGSIGAGPEVISRMLTILREGSLQARRAAILALGVVYWLIRDQDRHERAESAKNKPIKAGNAQLGELIDRTAERIMQLCGGRFAAKCGRRGGQ